MVRLNQKHQHHIFYLLQSNSNTQDRKTLAAFWKGSGCLGATGLHNIHKLHRQHLDENDERVVDKAHVLVSGAGAKHSVAVNIVYITFK